MSSVQIQATHDDCKTAFIRAQSFVDKMDCEVAKRDDMKKKRKIEDDANDLGARKASKDSYELFNQLRAEEKRADKLHVVKLQQPIQVKRTDVEEQAHLLELKKECESIKHQYQDELQRFEELNEHHMKQWEKMMSQELVLSKAQRAHEEKVHSFNGAMYAFLEMKKKHNDLIEKKAKEAKEANNDARAE